MTGEPGEQAERQTPEQVFVIRVRDAMNDFYLKQNEILRLAGFMAERATEIDNPAIRASIKIQSRFGSVDKSAVENLLKVFQDIEEHGTQGPGKSQTNENTPAAIAVAFHNAVKDLPDGSFRTYMDAVIEALHAPLGVDLLHSSLLVALVGELEMLVGSIARASAELRPKSFTDGSRSFTWSEISEHESLADFRDRVVDRAIEDVMRGSLSSWIKFFVNRFSIDEIQTVQGFKAQEVVQRRHCIVHNSGKISSSYLDSLKSFPIDGVLGDNLTVDGGYLTDAADTLYLVAYSLCWSLGFKLITGDAAKEYFETVIANWSFPLLLDKRFSLLTQIAAAAPIEKLEESSRIVLQVNCWLAYKLSGRLEEVRAEIEALDVRAKSRNFNLAKYALLDKVEEANKVAQDLIRDEQLTLEDFYTWPLLAGVREFAMKGTQDLEV